MKMETTYSAVLGRFLAQKRKDMRWDQAEIAKRTGINRSSWSRLENGETTPDAIQLEKIAAAFDTTSNQLLAEVGTIKKQLEQQKITVHMSTKAPKSGNNKLGLLLLGTVLGALITTLISGKPPDGK